MKLSIIVPTIGRPSLVRTLSSIQDAGIGALDEVLLVGDGPCPAAWFAWQQARLPGRYLETQTRSHDWGASPRNLAIPQAQGDYLLFMDDDDAYRPGALEIIRAALRLEPFLPLIFRMLRHESGTILWEHNRIECGNVSTQMFCIANVPQRLTLWPSYYAGDFGFFKEVAAKYDNEVVWREEVIADYLRMGPPLPGRAQLKGPG